MVAWKMEIQIVKRIQRIEGLKRILFSKISFFKKGFFTGLRSISVPTNKVCGKRKTSRAMQIFKK
jgi:hypothetical protein